MRGRVLLLLALLLLYPSRGDTRDCQVGNSPCDLCKNECYSERQIGQIVPGSVVTGTFDRPYPVRPCAQFEGGMREHDKRFFAYVPKPPPGTTLKVLVSIHGNGSQLTSSIARRYLDLVLNNQCHVTNPDICPRPTPYGAEFFDKHGIVVLAPHFAFANVEKNCREYLLDRFINDYGHRSDQWLIHLVRYLGQSITEQTGISVQTDRFYLFGQSQGGQFVNKFAYAHGERVLRAVAANSGLYVYPRSRTSVFDDLIAKGLTSAGAEGRLKEMLSFTPLAIIHGTEDRFQQLGVNFICQAHVQRYCSLPGYSCNRSPNPPGFRFSENSRPRLYQTGEQLHYSFPFSRCRLEWNWVLNAEHNGSLAYPTAAEFLFRGLQ